MRNWYAGLCLAVAAVAFLLGWTVVANAATITVDVKSNLFSPSDVAIKTGDTVRWVFDQGVHTTTSSDGLWDSGVLSPGSTFEHTFNDPGNFAYICALHFACCDMAGTIHVSKPKKPRPSPTPEPQPSPYPLPPLSLFPLFR
jgi:plastocyanin